jgi:DNA-nicking Smr family endonuclease
MSGTSNSFSIGEKVAFLYEKSGGIIRRFGANGLIFVEDEDGFERTFPAEELVKIHGTEYHLPDNAVAQINEDDTISTSRHTIKKEKQSGTNRSMDVWEIDLHIESLLDSHMGMSNSAILEVQMKEFKNFFSRAKTKHIRKLIVIHGVGAGVLKDDVRLFLDKKDGVEYYDADYREYGKGATAIEIRYSN